MDISKSELRAFIRSASEKFGLRRATSPRNNRRPLFHDNIFGDRDVISENHFQSGSGLIVSNTTLKEGKTVMLNGEVVIPPGGEYSGIIFIPYGSFSKTGSAITASMLKGEQSLASMFKAIDKGKFKPKPILMGETNLQMALIAQRLGFKVADHCLLPDGSINKSFGNLIVVAGRLSDIRRNLEGLKQSKALQKLQARANRIALEQGM